MVRRPGPPREGVISRTHVTYASRPGRFPEEALRGSITHEGASPTAQQSHRRSVQGHKRSVQHLGGLRYVRSHGDSG